MDFVRAAFGGTAVLDKTLPVPKINLNSRFIFIDVNQRTHPEARLMKCEVPTQACYGFRDPAFFFERLDNIANSEHPASQIVLTFYDPKNVG